MQSGVHDRGTGSGAVRLTAGQGQVHIAQLSPGLLAALAAAGAAVHAAERPGAAGPGGSQGL